MNEKQGCGKIWFCGSLVKRVKKKEVSKMENQNKMGIMPVPRLLISMAYPMIFSFLAPVCGRVVPCGLYYFEDFECGSLCVVCIYYCRIHGMYSGNFSDTEGVS